MIESLFELYFRNFNPDDHRRASIFFLIVVAFSTVFALKDQHKNRAILPDSLLDIWQCYLILFNVVRAWLNKVSMYHTSRYSNVAMGSQSISLQ